MANSDVKVKEIRLLESYSNTYNRLMESTIQMAYRFRNLFAQKDDQARDLEHKIKDHLNIAQQKYAHAKADYEAALKKNWKNYDTLELHFTGGTSYLIREELESRFGKFANFEKSYEDARFANAEGFVKHLAGKIARDAASR